MTRELTYDNGLNDGFVQGLAWAKVMIEQEIANRTQAQAEEPTRSIERPHDHDLKPLDPTA